MSAADDDASATGTIDRQGRLVIPKSIREEAGISPGVPLDIRVEDGRVVIEPRFLKVRIVKKDGFAVCEPLEPVEPITREEMRRWVHAVREGRVR